MFFVACALCIFGLPGRAGGGVVVAGFVEVVIDFDSACAPGVAPLVVPLAGVVVGVGKEVSGVGTGGRGFDKIPAIISFKPASDLLRNL